MQAFFPFLSKKPTSHLTTLLSPSASQDILLLNKGHLFSANNVRFSFFSSERREEVHGEAHRVLRTFPGKNEKESSGKQMPSFPEMVHYIQDKVQCFCPSK